MNLEENIGLEEDIHNNVNGFYSNSNYLNDESNLLLNNADLKTNDRLLNNNNNSYLKQKDSISNVSLSGAKSKINKNSYEDDKIHKHNDNEDDDELILLQNSNKGMIYTRNKLSLTLFFF